MNIARRSSLEPRQPGKVHLPMGWPKFHLEVSKSSNFAVHFARRGSSETCSPVVDIVVAREVNANIDMP